MADILRMPEVLAGVTEATINQWLVEPGAEVSVGQALAELETDKAVVEVPSDAAGVIGRLLVEAGNVVTVGDPMAVLTFDGDTDADIDEALALIGAMPAASADTEPATAPSPDESADPATAPTFSAPPTGAPSSGPGQRIFATPLVRRLAAEGGIDLRLLTGSGPRGRIVRRDLERHQSAPAAKATATVPNGAASATVSNDAAASTSAERPAAYEDISVSRMRSAIASRLVESTTTIPHFYLSADCVVDRLAALRAQINETAPVKITFNDLVIKAVAAAFAEVPEANAIWQGATIRRFSTVDISVAVALEGGLITPVVRGVESMSISQVHRNVSDLVERARAGSLRQDEIEGGSFSVSNLGMFGTQRFSAIINPPQSGILAVGAIRKQPVIDDQGEVAVASVMSVTLSADHRVIDGALAAQWLRAFQSAIDNPLALLI